MFEMKMTAWCLMFSIAGFVFERAGWNFASGVIILLGAASMYIIHYVKTRHFFNLPGLFSLFFIGGEGVACFKLSRLSASHWSVITWLSIFLVYAGFMFGYAVAERLKTPEKGILKKITDADRTKKDTKTLEKRLFICINAVCIISLACFLFEAVKLGFIPFFSDEPHAYSYFHISGVHYFTVTCVMVLPLTAVSYTHLRAHET